VKRRNRFQTPNRNSQSDKTNNSEWRWWWRACHCNSSKQLLQQI